MTDSPIIILTVFFFLVSGSPVLEYFYVVGSPTLEYFYRGLPLSPLFIIYVIFIIVDFPTLYSWVFFIEGFFTDYMFIVTLTLTGILTGL